MPNALSGCLLLLLLGSAPTLASEPLSLNCEVEGAGAEQLCAAVRAELSRRGGLSDADPALVLVAQSPRPDTLRARIDLVRNGQRQQGETGETVAMDRDGLAPGQLEDFARALVRRTGLFP
ncbi:hypothetical protein [Paracoccus sp. KR1-242]|uniref:hypothetical protein n=1 Tax=Paracoccus sp. KR1-242 TaxID=3410028 RepID=UPI003C309B6B